MFAVVHPLLRLMATQPELLAEHAQGYAALAADEMGACLAHLRRQLWLLALAILGATLALVLGGVAVLLWAVSADLPGGSPWLLWAVPACPLVLSGWCVVRLRAASGVPLWQALRAQLALDAAAWRKPGPT